MAGEPALQLAGDDGDRGERRRQLVGRAAGEGPQRAEATRALELLAHPGDVRLAFLERGPQAPDEGDDGERGDGERQPHAAHVHGKAATVGRPRVRREMQRMVDDHRQAAGARQEQHAVGDDDNTGHHDRHAARQGDARGRDVHHVKECEGVDRPAGHREQRGQHEDVGDDGAEDGAVAHPLAARHPRLHAEIGERARADHDEASVTRPLVSAVSATTQTCATTLAQRNFSSSENRSRLSSTSWARSAIPAC